MQGWARYPDGVELSEAAFRTLARYAPDGRLDVFASDQHGSYLKLIAAYFDHIGDPREATDDDVAHLCLAGFDRFDDTQILLYLSQHFWISAEFNCILVSELSVHPIARDRVDIPNVVVDRCISRVDLQRGIVDGE